MHEIKNPNLAQAEASDISHSVFLFANAGSGKTKVLIDRILNLLLSHVEARKILCLTYTKAAAGEMKARIAAKLKSWVVMKPEILAAEIAAILGRTPEAKMLDFARTLFAKVVDENENLKILTIHAFCSSILKRFPLEANVHPNFKVIDELASLEMMRGVYHDLIANAENDADLSEALHVVSENMNEQSFAKFTKRLLDNAAKFKKMREHYGDERTWLNSPFKFFELKDDASSAEVWQEFLAETSQKTAGMQQVGKTLAELSAKTKAAAGLEILTFLARPNKEKFSDYKRTFVTQENALNASLTKNLEPQIIAILEAEVERIKNFENKLLEIKLANYSKAVLKLAAFLINRYEELKRGQNVLDYNDLVNKTIRFLASPNINPWVMYKLDGGIEHILVDEAQDTSFEQWEIIKLLAQDFFVNEKEEGEFGRTIFAVGDKKQSIYSFQGAAPWIFEQMEEVVKNQAQGAGYNFKTVPLNISFRSSECVLSLVNSVFSSPQNAPGIKKEDEDITHLSFRGKTPSVVELWQALPMPEKKKKAEWRLPTEVVEKEENDNKLARLVAEKILQLISNKTYLPSRKRAVHAGDFLILIKKRDQLAKYIIKNLAKLGIPFSGADKLSVASNLAVKDLIAVANVARLPDDDLSFATVLKSPLFDLSEEELFELASPRGELSLYQSLEQKSADNRRFKEVLNNFLKIRKLSITLPPFDFFETILNRFGYKEKALAAMGEEAADSISEFLSLALAYQEKNPPSILEFINLITSENIELKRDNNNDKENNNSVRMMTVHSAKGLEAPIIIIPQSIKTSRRADAAFENLFFEDAFFVSAPEFDDYKNPKLARLEERRARLEEEEYRRLLYVALTRAEDRLYVGAAHKHGEDLAASWYSMMEKGFLDLGIKSAPDEFLSTHFGAPLESFRLEVKGGELEVAAEKIKQPAFVMPEWVNQPAKEMAYEEALEDGEYISALEKKTSFERGKIIHKLLEFVPPYNEKSYLEKGKRFLLSSGMAEKEAQDLLDKVAVIFKIPEINALFSKNGQSEVSVFVKEEGKSRTRRIDRMLVKDDEVLILDYKTNRIAPQNVAEIPSSYQEQLNDYKRILGRIYEGRKVRAFLLYIESMKLFEI